MTYNYFLIFWNLIILSSLANFMINVNTIRYYHERLSRDSNLLFLVPTCTLLHCLYCLCIYDLLLLSHFNIPRGNDIISNAKSTLFIVIHEIINLTETYVIFASLRPNPPFEWTAQYFNVEQVSRNVGAYNWCSGVLTGPGIDRDLRAPDCKQQALGGDAVTADTCVTVYLCSSTN